VPRRAGISSFGFSGVNVHAVVEEYQNGTPPAVPGIPGESVLVPLSAKTEEGLRTYAENLRGFLKKTGNQNSMAGTGNIAYTLQTGREHMRCRAAFAVTGTEDLAEKLGIFLKLPVNETAPGIHRGEKPETGAVSGDSGNILKGDMSETAENWVRGADYDWDLSYRGDRPRRVSLPTYPFARERYWITELPATPGSVPSPPAPAQAETHPGEQGDTEKEPAASGFLSELAEAPEAEHQTMMTDFLRNRLGLLLGFEPPNLPAPGQGFFEMGMESVQAVQFQSETEQELGVRISDTAAFDYPTIREFSGYLLELVSSEEPEPEGAVRPAPADSGLCEPPNRDSLPEDIRRMSAAEASEILESEIGYLIQEAWAVYEISEIDHVVSEAEKILETEGGLEMQD